MKDRNDNDFKDSDAFESTYDVDGLHKDDQSESPLFSPDNENIN